MAKDGYQFLMTFAKKNEEGKMKKQNKQAKAVGMMSPGRSVAGLAS